MKAFFLASGNRVPSCRFRVLQIVPHLRQLGVQCRIAFSFPQKYDYIKWIGFRPSQTLKRLMMWLRLLEFKARRFDVAIIERDLFHNSSYDFEQRFRAAAKVLVLDIDDAVFDEYPDKMPRIASMCDLVLAGNQLLVEWARQYNSNVLLMPTCIDTQVYQPVSHHSATMDDSGQSSNSRPPVVGWMGTTANLRYLEPLAPAFRELSKDYDFELRIIAGEDGPLREIDFSGVNLRFIPWRPQTEVDEVRRFDIGLMPLNDDRWSRYKCGLKLLQYMACGTPGVASPVGVNCEIIQDGENGFLASTPGQWQLAIGRLIDDSPLRVRLGAAARKTVLEGYSVQANMPRWIEAVERLLGEETQRR